MMKVNDFLKYEISLNISYEDYFRLIYDTKYLIEARLGPIGRLSQRNQFMGTAEKSRSKSRSMVLEDFKGVLGPAHKVMTVNDPHEEVTR